MNIDSNMILKIVVSHLVHDLSKSSKLSMCLCVYIYVCVCVCVCVCMYVCVRVCVCTLPFSAIVIFLQRILKNCTKLRNTLFAETLLFGIPTLHRMNKSLNISNIDKMYSRLKTI